MEDNEMFINTGAIHGHFNIGFFSGISDFSCSRSKVTLKLINVVNELELINEDLRGIYPLHKQLDIIYSSSTNDEMVTTASKLFSSIKVCRSIIHDLRVTCDMLLVMTSILKNYNEKIGVSNYYNKYDKAEVLWFDDSFRDSFKMLTECDNSSKHHFLTDLYLDSDFEQISFSYVFCGDNWNYANPEIRNISITNMVKQFNSFYEAVISFFASEHI